MASFADDPRHQKLVSVLVPLLRRTCPPGAGGYGGSYELRLASSEAEDLGGLLLIRSAMRKAAKELGWSKLETYGTGTGSVALVGVIDKREIPQEFSDVVESHKLARMRDAAEAVSQAMTSGFGRAVRDGANLRAQEFRAAYDAAATP
ncbi:hypothetical protein ABZX85_39755 [Streptomyces sp. NPDC004539]|uniref:hypothetical protein n=1 Tax=Streptomyces sp. NPDC004539 TaxID=3154280 RepID=UPI0033A71587